MLVVIIIDVIATNTAASKVRTLSASKVGMLSVWYSTPMLLRLMPFFLYGSAAQGGDSSHNSGEHKGKPITSRMIKGHSSHIRPKPAS